MKTIKLKNKDISYTIKKSKRAKKLRLSVRCDGSVIITIPKGVLEIFAEKFLIEKADWVLKKIDFFNQTQDSHITKLTRKDYLENKEKTFLMVSERLEYFNKFYCYEYNRISIKDQKTRWGSCSGKGNLNFNYKIMFLPDELRDYIIVHELCHLKEFNHSQNFWNLVAKTFPNFKKIKKELKMIGLSVG